MITNTTSGTNVHEIADGIYRINTPVAIPGQEFSFNQYLVVDEDPLLFHTGLRGLFPVVKEAIESLIPIERLKYVAFSHVEADECGSLNYFLEAAPNAVPACGAIAAMVSINDLADRPPRVLADGEHLSLGKHTVSWIDAPHMPHAWECGFMMEHSTRTMFSGDLFTQPGKGEIALTESDILGPSEEMRHQLDYFSHTANAREMISKLAVLQPTTLACMHGSAWTGDGENLLNALGDALAERTAVSA